MVNSSSKQPCRCYRASLQSEPSLLFPASLSEYAGRFEEKDRTESSTAITANRNTINQRVWERAEWLDDGDVSR
jgi:hypothetical protein